MRGSTSVGYDQFETSPEAIEQELRPAVCERRPTDRLKANYSIDGEVVDDLADIADIFNEHFSTVGERLVSNATQRGLVDDNIHLTRINSLEGKCTLPDITEEYVQKQISSMSVGKATGPDGISVKMLQIASRYITKSLTHISR